ncbi:MAG: hypothetical protein ACR5K4_02565 [Sodalis sp. (in: enterobacteria)]
MTKCNIKITVLLMMVMVADSMPGKTPLLCWKMASTFTALGDKVTLYVLLRFH